MTLRIRRLAVLLATLVSVFAVNTAAADSPPPLPPPPPPGEPAPIAGQGYTDVFGDEFDGPLVLQVWTEKQFWEDEPRAGAIVVSDGTVEISNARPYYGDQSLTTGPYWLGDPVKESWQFGYFEARMRFTDAKGSWPAFWLISKALMPRPTGPTARSPTSTSSWTSWNTRATSRRSSTVPSTATPGTSAGGTTNALGVHETLAPLQVTGMCSP